MKFIEKIIFRVFLLSMILPLLKTFGVIGIKDWSWLMTLLPFWGTLCIGMVVIWFVWLFKKFKRR